MKPVPFALARLRDGRTWLSELTGFYEFSHHLLSFAATSGRPSLTVTLPNRPSDVVALAPGSNQTAWLVDFGDDDVGEVRQSGAIG